MQPAGGGGGSGGGEEGEGEGEGERERGREGEKEREREGELDSGLERVKWIKRRPAIGNLRRAITISSTAGRRRSPGRPQPFSRQSYQFAESL